MTKTLAIAKTPEGVTALTEAPKTGAVLPAVDAKYSYEIASELLRVLDFIQPKREKSNARDIADQESNVKAVLADIPGARVDRAAMKKSGKVADDLVKFRRMAERFHDACRAMAQAAQVK